MVIKTKAAGKKGGALRDTHPAVILAVLLKARHAVSAAKGSALASCNIESDGWRYFVKEKWHFIKQALRQSLICIP